MVSNGKQAWLAQIIFRILCEGVQTEQYEEQLRLVFAPAEAEALKEARRVAQTDEAVFADRRGRIVTWQLVAVKSLQPVNLDHGALLFSQVREVEPLAATVWQQ